MTFQKDRSHAASSHSCERRSSAVTSLARQLPGRFSGRRAVIGLIVLAVLCTVALGLQERRSAPLTAATGDSPLEAGPRALRSERRTQTWVYKLGARVTQRAFWLKPWPWVGIGMLGFGALSWGLIWGSKEKRRD